MQLVVVKQEKHDENIFNMVAVIIAFIAMVIVTGASTISHNEGALVTHLHPVLNVMTNGKPITVPRNIGIDSSLHKDHSLDQYGAQGVAPLHTHDDRGTIHVESTVNRNYTLGEFLNVWGIDLNGKIVKFTADGTSVSDYKNHVLGDDRIDSRPYIVI